MGARKIVIAMVYGTAEAAGEIRKNQELMDQAYRLGEKLGLEA